jgi:hypothetical protein
MRDIRLAAIVVAIALAGAFLASRQPVNPPAPGLVREEADSGFIFLRNRGAPAEARRSR